MLRLLEPEFYLVYLILCLHITISQRPADLLLFLSKSHSSSVRATTISFRLDLTHSLTKFVDELRHNVTVQMA